MTYEEKIKMYKGKKAFIDNHSDSLEKKIAAHCSILAWRISWTEESGRLENQHYFIKY